MVWPGALLLAASHSDSFNAVQGCAGMCCALTGLVPPKCLSHGGVVVSLLVLVLVC